MTPEIGKSIVSGQKQEKDAIHIAIAPVVADCLLRSGEHIGFVKEDNKTVSNMAGKKIGIVDPFLTLPVKRGEQFWMFLYPNTIISLRHDWSHPDFTPKGDSFTKSKQWITDWAAGYGMSYKYAIECGRKRDFFIGDTIYDEVPEEFWEHFEIVTGERVSKESVEGLHFHCAC